MFAPPCPLVCKPEAIGRGITIRAKVEQKGRLIFFCVYFIGQFNYHNGENSMLTTIFLNPQLMYLSSKGGTLVCHLVQDLAIPVLYVHSQKKILVLDFFSYVK